MTVRRKMGLALAAAVALSCGVARAQDAWPTRPLRIIAPEALAAEALGFSGALGFGIGVIFTLPLAFLVKLALYEEIFNNAPPSRMPGLEKE